MRVGICSGGLKSANADKLFAKIKNLQRRYAFARHIRRIKNASRY